MCTYNKSQSIFFPLYYGRKISWQVCIGPCVARLPVIIFLSLFFSLFFSFFSFCFFRLSDWHIKHYIYVVAFILLYHGKTCVHCSFHDPWTMQCTHKPTRAHTDTQTHTQAPSNERWDAKSPKTEADLEEENEEWRRNSQTENTQIESSYSVKHFIGP